MKKLILTSILFFAFAFTGIAQTKTFNLPIKYRATSRSQILIGEKNLSSVPEGTTVTFNGQTLKLSLDNGNVFKEEKILNYKRLNLNLGDMPLIVYRLKFKQDGFETFAIITITITSDFTFESLKLPILSNTGEILGYNSYDGN